MKAEIYNALASLNHGFDVVLESLKVLQEEGVLTADYLQDNSVFVEELRAGINHMIVEKLAARETEDWAHFGKMRIAIEELQKAEPQPSLQINADTRRLEGLNQ